MSAKHVVKKFPAARERGFTMIEVMVAVSILANSRPELREKLRAFRIEQAEKVKAT